MTTSRSKGKKVGNIRNVVQGRDWDLTRVPRDVDATLERARADAQEMLRHGEQKVAICGTFIPVPVGVWRYFALGEWAIGIFGKTGLRGFVEEHTLAPIQRGDRGRQRQRRTSENSKGSVGRRIKRTPKR